jgi:biofilm PGA synthesis N-glycosyltransferase PgaC
MTEFLAGVGESPIYWGLMLFLAVFPVVISALAVNASRQYLLDRNRTDTEQHLPHLSDLMEARKLWPTMSIVIPARNEQDTIIDTVDGALDIDWPQLEVIVINDGSIDATGEALRRYQTHSDIRLVTHESPQGKSRSLNEGLTMATSELVLIMDADARPARNVLDRLVPHLFKHPDVAAVTGNPRVVNTRTLWGKMQAIEFSSTISTLRRGQAAWGRINTVSGILTVLRRDVVLELGGFSPTQPTEDIELTWRLQREGWRCTYEPAAQVGMVVPESLSQWWKQRVRWSSGLVRVLQAHGGVMLRRWRWPVFPLLLEASLSIIWCHVLIAATLFWVFAYTVGGPELGNSLIIGHWGSMTIGIAIVQILWGMHLDANHDKTITKLWPLAPIYPLLYWWLEAIVVVAATLPTLLTRPRTSTWSLNGPSRIHRT